MFCTSLRRRSSYSSICHTLTASSILGLREHKLDTHDIEVSVKSLADPVTGNTRTTRQLRFLLLSPSSTSDVELQNTLERVARFAALTGGQDIAIVFLLSHHAAASFVSARSLAHGIGGITDPCDGMHAYMKLQAELFTRDDIPNVSILPLAKPEGLPTLIKNHVKTLAKPKFLHPRPVDCSKMLAHCSSTPPLGQFAVDVVSDYFPSLRHLATAATVPEIQQVNDPLTQDSYNLRNWTARSPEHTADGGSLDVCHSLALLLDLLSRKEVQDIADFWKEEWVAE
ncbi:hypothetical protein LTR66_003677 [Elasticomyces elasticus]|nr:hypothetical protein LTR28_003448 [Elasticomyces elasticus]KAK4996777.1 hypothetical protein LTR66_003677 [Elasticomyces elasticus]